MSPLAPPPVWPHAGVDAWWARARPFFDAASIPFDAAQAVGAAADRVGYAFAAGYLAALEALAPKPGPAALCATEAGGAHPRAIETEARGAALHGEKTFVTLPQLADDLYVLAREGEADGRAILGLFRVRRDSPGVTLIDLPTLPFVPEIGHARVRLDGAPIAERLDGDGWTDWVKPFRTIEDIHVHGAVLSFLVASFRRWGARQPLERALATLASLRTLAGLDPSHPETHIALAGAIEQTKAFVESLDWSSAPGEARALWERDRPLLEVASKAREARRVRAWQRLEG